MHAFLCLLLAALGGVAEAEAREVGAGHGKQVRERSGRAVKLDRFRKWDIVLGRDAIASERYAASELQAFIERATGRRLSIAAEAEGKRRHIFVGDSAAMRASGVAFSIGDFGPEDLRIVAADGNIAIAGGRPRGTLYGVYMFLEDVLGVRFLTHDHTHVPTIDRSRRIGPLDWFYHPPLEFRSAYYGENGNTAFAVRLRNNATIASKPEYGGTARYALINHSFQNLIPTARYGKEHPEYYALREGRRRSDVGRRDWARDGTEPCMSNSNVIRVITENTLKQIARHPDRHNISVSQNDNNLFCQCDNCRAIDDAEGSHMGSLLKGVNHVAEAVAAKHPDIMVGTLAYLYSRKPPRSIKPRANVQIQLCSFRCCQYHAINDPDCSVNDVFCRDMDGWAGICENIYIWDYCVSFRNYLMPCANLRILDERFRYYVNNNVKGVMTQGAYNARGAEFADLRNYMACNLLWDPSRDGEALMGEFLDLHYGKAAPAIRRFIDVIHDRAAQSGLHPMCSQPSEAFGIDPEMAREGLAAFAEAMTLADDEAVRGRVEKASVAAYRLALEPVWDPNHARNASASTKKALASVALRFLDLCEKHGVSRASEEMSLRDYKPILLRNLGIEPAK